MINENDQGQEATLVEIMPDIIKDLGHEISPLIHLEYEMNSIFIRFSTARISTEKVQELMSSTLNLMNEIIYQLAEKGIGAEQSKIIRISKGRDPDLGVVEKSQPDNESIVPIKPNYGIRNILNKPNQWIEYEIIVKLNDPF